MGRRAMVACLAVVVAAAGSACGNDNSDAFRDLTDARADTEVSGRVLITGSSTVEPVSTLVGEVFRSQNGDVDIAVEGPGTGDGMARFCAGDADVTGASRPIKDEEAEACAEAGIEFVELAIGLDGVAVVVPEASEVECLNYADLYALIGPESLAVRHWTDGEPLARELGSDTAMPDENLVLTGPGEESGTYDSFVEQVLDPIGETRVESGDIAEFALGAARSDYAASANDNTIIDAVAADPGGLGWVGFSYAARAEGVRPVAVSETTDGPCVEPTEATIRDGSYPIARTLYLYVSVAAAERPVVAAVVDFYLAGLADFVRETDYVAVADPAATVARWEQRTTGSDAAPG